MNCLCSLRRCCASCVTSLAPAPLLPPSVPQESRWFWMAAGVARFVHGSWASRAHTCFPATARGGCSVTTAPASLETLGSVSVSVLSKKQESVRTCAYVCVRVRMCACVAGSGFSTSFLYRPTRSPECSKQTLMKPTNQHARRLSCCFHFIGV